MLCHDCNHRPCKALIYKEGLQAEFRLLSSSMTPSHKRNHLYRKYVVGEHGTLGRHVRVRIPECVVNFIRSLCPEPSGVYTGHRDISEDGEEDGEELGNDESFEAVLPEHHLGVVNYAEGARVKVCVTFENRVYPISNVRMFIQECSVPGWVVTFVGEEYTNATIICSTEATFHEVFYYCVDKVAEVTDVTYEKVFD